MTRNTNDEKRSTKEAPPWNGQIENNWRALTCLTVIFDMNMCCRPLLKTELCTVQSLVQA